MQAILRSKTTQRVALGVLAGALIVSGIMAAYARDSSHRLTGVPKATLPPDSDGVSVYQAAQRMRGTKILVSTEDRWLWLISGRDTLVSAPVAIGMGNTFEYNGKRYLFKTPRGRRTIRLKEENPVWTVPEWHYFERAARRGLKTVNLKEGEPYLLEDGTSLDIRRDQVGRINRFGNWWPFSQDFEIIFDGKIFIPPMNTVQRKVTQALGPYKLDMGDGYLIHGTHVYNEDSIGQAASHGCVRMRNADLAVMYELVEPGTPVFIF